jgi:hypothetical protein
MPRHEGRRPEAETPYDEPDYAQAPASARVSDQAVAPPPPPRRRARTWRRAGYPAEARRGENGRNGVLLAYALARVIRLIAGIVAAIIAAGIILVVLGANPGNDVVSAVHDVAKALVGPFDGMFTLDSAKATIAVNWGIAALVYLVLGAIIARLFETLALPRRD